MPGLLGFVGLDREPSKLSKFKWPHYIIAKEGMYLRNKNVLGEYFIKQKYIPAHVESMGDYDKGYFTYTAPKIPKKIVGEVLDFFRKVFEKDKTEAEVLLLFHSELKEFKVLVPWQICTGVSVDSLYDPTDVPEGWIVIGSIHSHCDFSAFHSGTDTADASVFNGLHVTIGHVNRADPSWDVMVMINEEQFDFADEEAVLELDDLDDYTAPEEWFSFIKEHLHEILALDFKGLSKDQLEAFEKAVRSSFLPVKTTSKTTSALPSVWGGKGNNYDEWWDHWEKKDDKTVDKWKNGSWENGQWRNNSDYISTYFNEQFRKSFPSTMMNSKREILAEFIGEVLIGELEKLVVIAMEYGIDVSYSLNGNEALDDKALEGAVVIEQPNEESKLSKPYSGYRVFDALTGKWNDEVEDSDYSALDDISDYVGEDGFFRAMRKIVDESKDQNEIDKRLAMLINMED